MNYSQRVQRIEPSATVAVGNLAAKLKSEGTDIIDLSVGEPDFNTPHSVVKAGQEAIAAGHTGYTPSKGVPELREVIAAHLNGLGMAYDASNIIVTPGAKQALFETVQAVVDPGDEVVMPTPAWVSYSPMVTMAGGSMTMVDTLPHNFDLEPALADLEAAITERTTMLILNSPANPTGEVYSESALKGVRDLAVDHDLTVLSDEIYRGISYGDPPLSTGALDGMLERTVTVNGFSKTYAMTGWRLGYLAAPSGLAEQIAKVQSHSVTCAPNFVQRAGITALTETKPDVERMVSEFHERRDSLLDALAANGISVAAPGGAFYVMIPVDDDDKQWCKDAIEEAHVATVPGSAFEAPGYARIAYTREPDKLREAVNRLVSSGLL